MPHPSPPLLLGLVVWSWHPEVTLADRFVLLKTRWAWPWGSKTNCSSVCASPLNSLITRAEARTIPLKTDLLSGEHFLFPFFLTEIWLEIFFFFFGNFHFRTNCFCFLFFSCGKISGAFGFFPSEKPSLLLQIPLLLYLVITGQLCWWIHLRKWLPAEFRF